MNVFSSFIPKNLSQILNLIFISLCLVWVFVYFWKRRWVYYYGSKLPGPFSLPVIGTLELAFAGQKGIFNVLEKFLKNSPSVFKCWAATQLCIFTSRPSDVEFLLCNCLQKEKFSLYDYNEENISSIFTSKVKVWKLHRKIINPSFNPKIINSYTKIFVKYAKKLNLELENHFTNKPFDILPVIWKYTLDTLFETLADAQPYLLSKKSDNFIRKLIRYEQILTERYFNIIYRSDFFWKLSSLSKETQSIIKEMFIYSKELIQLHKSFKNVLDKENNNEDLKKKHFLNQLLSKDLTNLEVEGETIFMFMAGSETTALTISSVLLILSIYPEIQENIYQELCSILKNSDSEITLDDINSMNYLERVIKETLRLLPPAPYVARYINKSTQLESYILPADSAVIIPIWYIHKNPEFWPNPNKFDPDRFLPEEIDKRPRTSYIPFSYGPRNCIGLRYGMQSMKSILSTVLRNFEVERSKYTSIEEIEMEFHFVGKVKKGYQVCLKKRKS